MATTSIYSMQKLDSNRYLVFGTNYVRLEELFANVNQDLKKKKFRGELILDLLLSNGNNSSRFFKINFNGDHVDLESLKKIQVPDHTTIQKVNSYLKKHIEVLSNGILSTAEIERLKASL